jgi:L-asparaginase II
MANEFFSSDYYPIYELTRGGTQECVHFGAVSVVNSLGEKIAWYGNPAAVTFLRSSAKPFQALPFIERNGNTVFGLTPREVAIICASHSGTDTHVEVLSSLQSKVHVLESQLLCGVHDPLDKTTRDEMRKRGEISTSNRHNCSGKHTGMLAFENLLEITNEEVDGTIPYIESQHAVQKHILRTFSEMTDVSIENIHLGVDGCSVPTFAVPLENAALAYARLSDPEGAGINSRYRQLACHYITKSMMDHPFMVGGPARFDTRLMEVTHGRIVSKGGAEGYQAIGIMAGGLKKNSPGVGITLKIADGDARGKVCSAVAMDVLRQLGALSIDELDQLSEFGPGINIYNWRKIEAGEGHPIFTLETPSP